VESIWDQTDDQIVFGNFSIKRFVVCDIERNGPSILDALGELLCTFESSASFSRISQDNKADLPALLTNRDLNASVTEHIEGGPGHKTSTQHEDFPVRQLVVEQPSFCACTYFDDAMITRRFQDWIFADQMKMNYTGRI
jgi:hypothetical protein